MHSNWLAGTALVAIFAASPAFAQTTPSDFGQCALNEMTNEEFIGLDLNDDSGLTLDEYRECLTQNSIEVGEDAVSSLFDEVDSNTDGRLEYAEVEGYAGSQAADAGDQTGGARPAQVAVDQAKPEVNVQQAAPTVRVDQANPQVAVSQPRPQVDVQQREPQVDVSQPEPEVSVRQPEPTVDVQQPEPQVAIQQPAPQVQIDAPPPEVEVRQAEPQVRVEQRRPQVSVQQPEPQVSVEQAEAEVSVESAEPKVVIEQGEPEVTIETVTEAGASGATDQGGSTDAGATGQSEATQTAMNDTGASGSAEPDPASAMVPFADVEGQSAYNTAGDEIGEVGDIVMETASGDLFAVVGAGGFLGIGEADVVFPYSDVSIVDDRVVIDTNLANDSLEERTDYNEDLYEEVPEDRIVR